MTTVSKKRRVAVRNWIRAVWHFWRQRSFGRTWAGREPNEARYHPLVRQDVLEAARKYHDISPRLAEELNPELKVWITKAVENPLRFHPADQGFRRANSKHFPYH